MSYMEIEVAGLFTYPIKGCGGIAHYEIEFGDNGMLHDREWMLVDSDDKVITQRTHPAMARINTLIYGGMLLVSDPATGICEIALETENPRPDTEREISIYDKTGTAVAEDPEASEFFSDFFNEPVTLLHIKQQRRFKPQYQHAGAGTGTAFADGYPELITSISSLDALNAHGQTHIPMDRFRPNMVLAGELPAYDEDYYRVLQIGALTAYIVKASARCTVTNVDQAPGILEPGSPVTRALAIDRRGRGPDSNKPGVYFGQNATHRLEPGVSVALGDTVEVLERAAERNFQLI